MATKKQNEFVEYMKQKWISTHQNWYEGVFIKNPSQNNGLESYNLVVKKTH